MRKLIIISIFFALLFTSHIAYADQCVQPTPPVCYGNVPNPDTQYVGITLPNGQVLSLNGGGVGPTAKQVEVSCNGTQKEIDYEAQQLSYNTCLQVNAINSNTPSSESQKTSLNDDSSLIQMCPYPQQPISQASQSPIDTVEFPAGLITMKKYSDNTYATFLVSYYVGTGSKKSFLMLQAGQKDDNLISQALNANNLDEMARLQGQQKQYITYANLLQHSIDKYYADKVNCPDPSAQTSDLSAQSNAPSTISSSIKTSSSASTLSAVKNKTLIPSQSVPKKIIAPTVILSSETINALFTSGPKTISTPQSIAVVNLSLLEKIGKFFNKLKFW